MARKHLDLYKNTLANSIDDSQATFDLTDASGLGTITSGDFIPLTIYDNAGNFEIIHVHSYSTNTLTVLRGQEGSTAQAWSSLAKVECRLTAQGIDQKPGALASIYATLPGTYVIFTGKLRFYPSTDITLTNIVVSSGTPVAGTNSTFDVKKNGTSIFSGTFPTISIGNNTSTPIALAIDLTSSDYLTIDCTAAGGSDASIRIDYEPTE